MRHHASAQLLLLARAAAQALYQCGGGRATARAWEQPPGTAPFTAKAVTWYVSRAVVRDGFIPDDRVAELALFVLNNLPAAAPPATHAPGSPGTSSDHASASPLPDPSAPQVPPPGGWLPLAQAGPHHLDGGVGPPPDPAAQGPAAPALSETATEPEPAPQPAPSAPPPFPSPPRAPPPPSRRPPPRPATRRTPRSGLPALPPRNTSRTPAWRTLRPL